MRYWGYSAPVEELKKVIEAQNAYRRLWEAGWGPGRPPFPATFDGTVNDVRALDFLKYEGIGHADCSLERAALVCGEVLRRAAGFEWVISYRGDWMVATHEHVSPSFAVCPLARLHEAECGDGVSFGKHAWFVSQAALRAIPIADDVAEEPLRQLIDMAYVDWLRDALKSITRGQIAIADCAVVSD